MHAEALGISVRCIAVAHIIWTGQLSGLGLGASGNGFRMHLRTPLAHMLMLSALSQQ